MKKIALLILFLTTGFADEIILDNQSGYPRAQEKSKIAIQWASSAKEVQEHNQSSIHGFKLNSRTIKSLNQTGKLKIFVPKNAEYFRILVWPNGKEHPEFLTNWVEVLPNKSYLLKSDHLIPSVLMIGMGC